MVEKFYAELDAGFDAVFSVGTTSSFPYIAGPVEMARRRGWFSVEINPGTTRVSSLVDVKISLGAAAALDAIWQRCQEVLRSGSSGPAAECGQLRLNHGFGEGELRKQVLFDNANPTFCVSSYTCPKEREAENILVGHARFAPHADLAEIEPQSV